MPDANWLLSQVEDTTSTPLGRKGRVSNRDINLQEDFNNSQFLQDANENDDDLALAPMDDLELELDFGMDLDGIEVGREAPAARSVEDDIFSEMDVIPRHKEPAEPSMAFDFGADGIRIADDEGDIQMGDDDFGFNFGDQSVAPGPSTTAVNLGRARISESPLSDIDEDFAKQVEAEYTRHTHTDLYEPEDELDATITRQPSQRIKKRRILVPDQQTMLSSNHIKDQQANRENILKPQSFLPRDPYMLALMEMQRSGGFVSNIMLEGRSSNWAPELRGLLSLDVARRTSELKRKRDSGIADMDSDHGGTLKSPRLELDEDDDFAVGGGGLGNQSQVPDGTILDIPADDGHAHQGDDDHDHERDGNSYLPAFDETTAPLVHPADSGPVSLGTKHAVHILRDLFGSEAATNADKRKKTSVVFQELLPEKRTTKADATKMFFECLVLATKDAIKVEQGSDLGAPIRVRGKRGLWGDWAEREAGGEIAHQMEPEPAAASAPIVAVEA